MTHLLLRSSLIVLASTVWSKRVHRDMSRHILRQAEMPETTTTTKAKPNVLFFLLDDAGLGDLPLFGSPNASTPKIDSLAKQGTVLRHMVSAAPLCTPSRASIQTGRFAIRTGCMGNSGSNRVIPTSAHPGGLDPKLTPVAVALKGAGYATGMSGKWHLGNHGNKEGDPDYRWTPLANGYDSYLGLPDGLTGSCTPDGAGWAKDASQCYMLANQTVVQQPINVVGSTALFTQHAVDFVEAQSDSKPWFFFMSYLQMHSPLAPHEEFHNKTVGAEFGDTMLEVDDSVGQIMDAVKTKGFMPNTLVVFTSDNGAHVEDGWEEAGRNNFYDDEGTFVTKLRGGKAQLWDGGIRVPGFLVWPGRVPSEHSTHALVSTIDIYPTILSAAGVEIPENVDGKDMLQVVQPGGETSHSTFPHFCGFNIIAMRVNGRFKVHWKTQKWYTADPPDFSVCTECCNGLNKQAAALGIKVANLCGCDDVDEHNPPIVYDILSDPGEKHVLSDDSFPSGTGLTLADVIKKATEAKDTLDNKSGFPSPDDRGAGTCNAGGPDPVRQSCCPGCKAVKDGFFRKCQKDGEACTCDLAEGESFYRPLKSA